MCDRVIRERNLRFFSRNVKVAFHQKVEDRKKAVQMKNGDNFLRGSLLPFLKALEILPIFLSSSMITSALKQKRR